MTDRRVQRLDRRVWLLLASLAAQGCATPAPKASPPSEDRRAGLATRDTGQGRPPLTEVTRDGDARGAVAIAVTTEGIGRGRGALVGVALAALVHERLTAQGVDTEAIGGWNGWRLRALVATPLDMGRLIGAIRAALLAPVTAGEPALGAVARKAAALAARPLVDGALVDVGRCTGEAFGSGAEALPTAAEVESWRAAAHGLGRVAIASAGDAALANAAARELGEAPAWPQAEPIVTAPWPPSDPRVVVYDASGELAPGGARIIVTAHTATAERAVAAAALLGEPQGPLASRLEALEAPARLRSVMATAHVDGGCLSATLDLAPHDLAADAPARIATAAALARQELAVEVADVTAPTDLGRALALRASDPRDAAERAAWWSLAGRRAGVSESDVRVELIVGVAAARDASEPATLARAEDIRTELDRATLAWHARVVESRTKVEFGQGEVWVLLASPCGTLSEDAGDAGASAAVALAAATTASQSEGIAASARVEPFVAPDGIGVIVHGPRRAGETPEAQARRLADVASRAFAADGLQRQPASSARSTLLARASRADAWPSAMLASALTPGHPSWVDAFGTVFGLSSLSDETVALRAAGIRAGPLRVAVLANVDDSQAKAAVRAADRWIVRRASESRACPSAMTIPAARSATYAVDRPLGAPSVAILALPLPPSDSAARTAGTWLAAALDGPDGPLAHALHPERAPSAAGPLAETWTASLLAAPQSVALVIRLTAPDASLDAAVAQVRALLDRIRQGALREDDRARAEGRIEQAALTASLQPRARTIALWRGDAPSPAPSLPALRAFAASTIRDDALVIVAARPRHVDASAKGSPRGESPSERGRTHP